MIQFGRFFLALVLILITSNPSQSFADSGCSVPGDVPITAATRGAATLAGIPSVATCWNPNDSRTGLVVGEAKVYLNNLPKRCVGQCAAPPDSTHIAHLNNTFAVCAANFFKSYTQKYGGVYISSAYRDGPSGENARAGGAPNSNHTRGLAIDVSPANGDFPTMWKFASQNPQLGVCFPYLGSDRPHMTLAGSGTGEANKCAAQGVTQVCSGAPIFDTKSVTSSGPTSAYDENGAAYGNAGIFGQQAMNSSACLTSLNPPVVAQAGTVPISQCVTQGQTPQLTQTTAPVGTATPSPTPSPTTNPTTNPSTNPTQPQICDPKFTCTANVRSYRSSSCANQVIQTCSAGCSINGTDCAISTSTAATSTNSSGTGSSVDIGSSFDIGNNTNDNTNENSNPSVSTLLNSLANTPLFSSAEVGTTAPTTFVLNASTGDIEQLDAQGGTGSIAPGTITSIQPTGPQSFTSTGFTTGYTDGGTYSPQQVSTFQGILNNLKSSLLWALGVLNPFGSNAAAQPTQ